MRGAGRARERRWRRRVPLGRWSLGGERERRQPSFWEARSQKSPRLSSATVPGGGNPLICALMRAGRGPGVWGLVVAVAGAIPALRAVFAFALMPRSRHRSLTTWMHFCVPRCPLIREYFLFLERLITLKEWVSVPVSSWLHFFCLSCFDPLQCFDPSFLPSLDGREKEYPGWDSSVSLSDIN